MYVPEGETLHSELNVAIVGCSHGELDKIFDTLRQRESDLQIKIDLLLCCGDFQAMRNSADLFHFKCPPKYIRLGDFHKYYSGEKEAPCLTIFIGGNHESPAFSMELPHGGWVAKNIYYMGFASVVNFGGLRIGGWSGIFKQSDYLTTHYESPPFGGGQHISAYHVRAIEKFRLGLLRNRKANCLDVFMTHDWPVGITKFGDENGLLRYKKHFREDIERDELGNPYSTQLIFETRPRHWFAGHLHCKFEATVNHEVSEECEEESTTEFLALHKCDSRNPHQTRFFDELRYDPTWLAILHKTFELEVAIRMLSQIPEKIDNYLPSDEDLRQIEERFNGDFRIPLNFRTTAIPEKWFVNNPFDGAYYYRNPQTKEFCERLEIPDLNEQLCLANMGRVGDPYYLNEQVEQDVRNEDEIDIDEAFDDGEDFVVDTKPLKRQAEDKEVEASSKSKPRIE